MDKLVGSFRLQRTGTLLVPKATRNSEKKKDSHHLCYRLISRWCPKLKIQHCCYQGTTGNTILIVICPHPIGRAGLHCIYVNIIHFNASSKQTSPQKKKLYFLLFSVSPHNYQAHISLSHSFTSLPQ
jgi:hypothetical protein